MKLKNKTVLVTGASSGLGAHFSRVLAREGAQVTVAARRLDRLESLSAEIGGAATAVSLDVTDPDSVAAAFDGRAYDIVINNAGVTHTGAALDIGEDDWAKVIEICHRAPRDLVLSVECGTVDQAERSIQHLKPLLST